MLEMGSGVVGWTEEGFGGEEGGRFGFSLELGVGRSLVAWLEVWLGEGIG